MGAALALLPSIFQAITAGVKAIQDIRSAAQQSGEWTPEHEAAYSLALAQKFTEPQWTVRTEKPE